MSKPSDTRDIHSALTAFLLPKEGLLAKMAPEFSLDSQMDFDMTLATKKSNENPVYYAQYATSSTSRDLRYLFESFDQETTTTSDTRVLLKQTHIVQDKKKENK